MYSDPKLRPKENEIHNLLDESICLYTLIKGNYNKKDIDINVKSKSKSFVIMPTSKNSNLYELADTLNKEHMDYFANSYIVKTKKKDNGFTLKFIE